MATKLSLTIPTAIDVQSVDVEFEVRDKSTNELVGRVKISRGDIDWYRKSARNVTGTATWRQFQDWMEA